MVVDEECETIQTTEMMAVIMQIETVIVLLRHGSGWIEDRANEAVQEIGKDPTQ